MHIAVDARELCGKPAGVGRYLAELLSEWSAAPAARRHDWTLIAHRAPSATAALGRVLVVPGSGGTAWEQWSLARALSGLGADLLFAPGYTAPVRSSCPVALTVHDVSFCAHPEWFSRREGWRRRTLTRWSARRAAVVLTVSRFSAGEITRHLGVPPSRIRTIPHGMRYAGPRRPAARADRQPMVLYVGSIFERRNVDLLISAFATDVVPVVPGARLEIVGENRLLGGATLDLDGLLRSAPQARDRIAIRSYVDDATLAGLYRQASVFAFPSSYEGFGFTPLEALAQGVPPVVLDTPIAREVYEDAARYVDAGHPRDGLGQALVELLTSSAAREAVLGAAPRVLSRYDWSHAAAATLAALEECAGG